MVGINCGENSQEESVTVPVKNRYLQNRGWINPTELPVDENGYRCCRYCNGPITASRRRTFCSDKCVDSHRIRSSGSYLRNKVYQRDRGICSICGLDTKELAKNIRESDLIEKQRLLEEYKIPPKRGQKIRKIKNGGGLWDADHINPVKNGGGQCGLDNIRTLCISCHKVITYSKKN
jgi:5-methylcytosine-specific restriction enzyme A